MRSQNSFRSTAVLSVVSLLAACVVAGCDREPPSRGTTPLSMERPNILLIVVDDVGYSDIGSFGSEIRTPNIDELASEGTMLTQFHVFPNCGPTRGAMMTGVDAHRAGMGGNHEVAAENQRGKPGYEGHLRKDVVTVAQLLRDSGYHTYMTGKWHLGTGDNDPAARGFEKSFALMNGAASHWADQAPIIPGANTRYTKDGEIIEELPTDFYSSQFYTDEMISYIRSANDAPFFAYLSYTAPHNPLHAPQPYIEKYRGRFDAGWDALTAQRLVRQKSLGLVPSSQTIQPRPGWVMAWNELSAAQQAARARDMEVYAAMLDYVDTQIGRLLAELRQSDKYNNTLIVFLSDNGPSKTSIVDYLALGGESSSFFADFDNSLANRGLPGSSTDIGPGWAYAAATPLRLFKGYVAQGGIQVPAIIKLPGGMPDAGGQLTKLTHVMDLMPTFLSAAQTNYPASYAGKDLVPLAGDSLLPLMVSQSTAADAPREFGWSAYGMDAYRRGNWKVLRLPEPYGNGDWQLYDLSVNPGETRDLAATFPERVEQLADAWAAYAESNGVIQPDTPTAYAKPVTGRKH